jgi:hypothetical protein
MRDRNTRILFHCPSFRDLRPTFSQVRALFYAVIFPLARTVLEIGHETS